MIKNAERILNEGYKDILELVQLNKKKVVYLGSSTLKGLAEEACLKHVTSVTHVSFSLVVEKSLFNRFS
jgi:fructoselysine-6-P-deglycase FrlB-like protein